MKKYFLVFLVLLIVLSFAGCKHTEFAVGIEDDAVYFHEAWRMPEILFAESGDLSIEEKPFVEKLAAVIDGKTPIYDVCNCLPIYHVSIGSYTFALHRHSVEIYIVTEQGEKDRMCSVDCTEEEMRGLFDILEEASGLPKYEM